MAIAVKSEAEFARLLEDLMDELVDASIHYRMYIDLDKANHEYRDVFRQTWTFWSLTLRAHLDTTLFRLCRVYDTHPKGLNLTNMLDAIEQYPGYFVVDRFRERLKDNPNVDSLATDLKPIGKPEIQADRIAVSSADGRVKTLIVWRNNFFAHKTSKDLEAQRTLTTQYPLLHTDIEALFKLAFGILHKYTHWFNASSYSDQIVGHDDYKYMLRTIRTDLQRQEQMLNEEMARMLPKP